MKIDQKFRNGLWLFVQQQKANVFNNNRLCLQGIKMQFFPKRVVETLKEWAPVPVKLHSSAPPRTWQAQIKSYFL